MRTARGRALVDRHRTAQAALSRRTIAQMLQLWPLLTTGGPTDETQRRWIAAALLVLAARRRESAALAVRFSTAYRIAEGVTDGAFVPTPAVTLPVEAVTTSLSVLGPVAYRREVARQLGKDPREVTPLDLRETRLPGGIQAKLAANTARAAQRHVLQGARETLDDVQNDRRVVGWMRVTDGAPCWFCAMLASRGPVYGEDSFAESNERHNGPGNARAHDSCGCLLVPMYSRVEGSDEEVALARYREYDRLWRENPSAAAFRKAYEDIHPRS